MAFPTFFFGLDNAVIKSVINPYRFGTPVGIEGPSPGRIGDSILGTPYYADLTFKGASYTDSSGNAKQFFDVQLITVIVTVNQSKNIVTTAIQGQDGTVKEYIGMGDYEITINGIITSTQVTDQLTLVPGNGIYPSADVAQLKLMLDANQAIEVTSWFLNRLGVTHIVVKDYSIPQTEGGLSQQPFTISALSDGGVQAFVTGG